jgi:hypothetical protein
MKDRRWLRTKRSYLWAALALGVVVGAGALVGAAVPHTFNTGDTLTAADLNNTIAALDERIAALESNPFAGTYPAVRGLGTGPGGGGGGWFCGAAPTTINMATTIPATGFTGSNAFGDIVFTSGGAFGFDLSLATATNACPTMEVCSSPITFFLKSPVAQTITVSAYVDDTGAAYVNGMRQALGVSGNVTVSYTAMANMPFTLSFMSCSSNGPSTAITVNDQFITKYNLQVDYDATFHRNGK